MKKYIALVLILLYMLCMPGCDPGVKMVDGEELLENTVKIELYDYDNKNPKLYRLNGKQMPTFDFGKATWIAALEETRFEAVIKDIAERQYAVFGKVLNEPIGKTLILYQENGNMLVLFGCVYKNGIGLTKYYGDCNVFDENGRFIEHIGRVSSDYIDILEQEYFETDP